MGKRKRGGPQESTVQPVDLKQSEEQPEHGGVAFDPERSNKAPISFDYPIAIQIVVGTYEKVLHGVTATIRERKQAPATETIDVEFADTFLFSAHTSAIRCLAFSPPSSQAGPRKVFLASGASDQVVNLYQLSTEAPSYASSHASTLPVLSGHKVLSNPGNRELGSLQNHGGGVNELHFPTRSKLMSAAEDCTIAITRTRDWSMLSTIKTPIPKLHGRPSGDTAPLGGAPSGVNGFAVHPSMKLMVSVSKGEKCMRLWNLVTGKKAGVLNFEKQMLQKIGEAKWASGEGRRVRWNNTGDEFTIAFEKGCVTYGLVWTPCKDVPETSSLYHRTQKSNVLRCHHPCRKSTNYITSHFRKMQKTAQSCWLFLLKMVGYCFFSQQQIKAVAMVTRQTNLIQSCLPYVSLEVQMKASPAESRISKYYERAKQMNCLS